jgi:uncharacterized protein YjbI with pentapeptide repeats
MANDQHVAILKKGVTAWNAWRDENPRVGVDLSKADLVGANLRRARLRGAYLWETNLNGANLHGAGLERANLRGAGLEKTNLRGARLDGADLRGANLRGAELHGAGLEKANLKTADLGQANLSWARLYRADLRGADLRGANLSGADLRRADLSDANLTRASLSDANLTGASLTGAKLTGASLYGATLVETDLTDADLTGCSIYGVSAWRLTLKKAKQQDLVITREDEPTVTVDNIEVAQFVYFMLKNDRIRDVIDTITSKAVLILGRFTYERKAVLDALREDLRKRNYLPILFDFNVPAKRDITETVSLLARMARFIIADLTDPSSIPKELEAIIPHVAAPVQPVLEASSPLYAMFKDYWKYDWVLPIYRYKAKGQLLATLAEKVIAPAEGKVKALEERRRIIEAELLKPS